MAQRLLVLLLPALLIVMVSGALWLTFKGFSPTEIAAESTAQQPRYEMENAQWLRYGEDGELELRAQAERIEYFDDRSMQLDSVQIDRLGSQGPWTLTAERGEVPPRTERMQLLPRAQVQGQRSGQPVTITAPQVWVDWSKKTIHSSQRINMSSPGRTLDAIGFEADWQGERLRFLRNVEMRYVTP